MSIDTNRKGWDWELGARFSVERWRAGTIVPSARMSCHRTREKDNVDFSKVVVQKIAIEHTYES